MDEDKVPANIVSQIKDDDFKITPELYDAIFTPQDESLVAKSEHFEEIMNLVLSGWGYKAIENYLKERYKEEIKSTSISKYVKEFFPEPLLKKSDAIKKEFKFFDVAVNELKTIQELIMVQQNRLAMELEAEKTAKMTIRGTSKTMEILLKLLSESARLKMELGILKKEPEEVKVGFQDNRPQIPKDSVEKVVGLIGVFEKIVSKNADVDVGAVLTKLQENAEKEQNKVIDVEPQEVEKEPDTQDKISE